MSTRLSLYPCQAINKRGRIEPDRRPLKSQPIPSKPGKVVVQMVVYLRGITTWKPVQRSPSPFPENPVLNWVFKHKVQLPVGALPRVQLGKSIRISTPLGHD
jgi:hypothetical protein